MTNTEKNGTVLTWPSHAVAAIVYPNGDAACVQSAQSAKARNMSGGGGLSGSLPTGEAVSAQIAQAITEAVASIQDRNDVATFLDVALFQICAISRNRNLSNADTVALINNALTTSATIAKARPQHANPTRVAVSANGAILTYPGAPAPAPGAGGDDIEAEGAENSSTPPEDETP